jgi:hypothetical protein
MTTLSLRNLAQNSTLTNVCRVVVFVIFLGLVWRQRGMAISPIRWTDVICIGPILASLFCKPSGRVFWFLWGIAVGGFVVHMLLLKYLVPGVHP